MDFSKALCRGPSPKAAKGKGKAGKAKKKK